MRRINPETNYDSDELFEHYRLAVDPGQHLMRLDKFLTQRLPSVTRNRLQNAIKADLVLVNGQAVKSNYKVRPNDEIQIFLPEPPRTNDIIPEPMTLPIIYEDDHLLLINKPAGLVVHPATENWTGTMVNGLFHYLQEKGLAFPGLVHRIDKDTTGLLVIPKDEATKLHLARQFAEHTTQRTYRALVWGEVAQDSGTIEGAIARSHKDRRVMTVLPDNSRGKPAISHYTVLERFRYVSLVECRLETGRTHQIRAHFRFIGHPLFGDSMYGGDKILKGAVFSKYKSFVENCFSVLSRQALHAKSLGFVHPATGAQMHFDSQLPEDMQSVIEKWRSYVQYN
ncbi:MAG: RluA family pseudouridine synthase [Bernardetiaceae bacterium]